MARKVLFALSMMMVFLVGFAGSNADAQYYHHRYHHPYYHHRYYRHYHHGPYRRY